MGNSYLLFESLFKRPASANDAKDYLIDITEQHPYFTAAHFFLLQQPTLSSIEFKVQAAKTALLFNNPFWLNYQLQQLNTAETFPPTANSDTITVDNKLVAIAANEVPAGIAALPEIDVPLRQTVESAALPIETIEANKVEPDATALSMQNKAINVTEHAAQPAIANNNIAQHPENTIENKEPIVPIYTNKEITDINSNGASSFPTKFNLNNKDNMEDPEASAETEESYEADETEIEPMNIRLNFTPDIATTEETISFEPLHTSDYFASLGIKLNEDGMPVDKLGRQLKSFTEWLKTMKKIHSDQLQATNEQTDIIIQKMAEKSNTEGDVLTEAMAEVLMHQGKLRKAIELYQKLSLLNPAKSAYFAAKIEQIAR